MFHNKLDGFGGDPRVVVGTNINPKIESSSAGISSSGLATNKSRVSAAVKVFKKALNE
ncbi:unnamed protein product [Brassica oleracea var. botrytis]